MSDAQAKPPAPVIYRGLEEIAGALRPPGVDSRGNPHPVPSIATVKRWIRRAVNPLPARHDANGWYLRRVDAVIWLNQGDVPGQTYEELIRLRKRLAVQNGSAKRPNQTPREISQGGPARAPAPDRL